MINKKTKILYSLASVFLLTTVSCSLKDPEKVSVSIQFDSDPASSQSMMLLNSTPATPYISPLPNFTTVTPPSSVNGFDCLGVNVMGEGIPPVDMGEEMGQDFSNFQNNMADIISGTVCASYPGAVSTLTPVASGNQSISVNVPSGSTRIVQVIGFKSTIGCPSYTDFAGVMRDLNQNQNQNNNFDTYFPAAYQVGRTVTDIFKDTTLDIQSSYTGASTQQLSNCGNTGNTSGYYFYPPSVPGIKLWLKADAGVKNVAGDPAAGGDPVATWEDQSGYGNNVTQSSSPMRPTYILSDGNSPINNNPTVVFGGAHYIDRTPGLGSFTGLTVIGVARHEAGSNGSYVCATSGGFSGTDDYFQVKRSGGFYNEVYVNRNGGVLASVLSTVSNTNYHVESMLWDGSSLSYYIDGTSAGSPASFSGTLSPNSKFTVGSLGGTFTGRVAEVIVYDNAISSNNRSYIECYLSYKYGISTSHNCMGN